MNSEKYCGVNPRTTLIATTVAAVLLAACAAAPVKPDGSAEVRGKLTQLQSDPNLASRAPLAIKEADAAVRIAEQPQADQQLAAHRVYLADRKVEIARAQAETRLAEDQRSALSAQREAPVSMPAREKPTPPRVRSRLPAPQVPSRSWRLTSSSLRPAPKVPSRNWRLTKPAMIRMPRR